jgi:hypothetical protein
VGEDTNPYLASPFDVPGDGDTGCFDLARCYPSGRKSLESKISKAELIASHRGASHAALHLFSVFDFLGH